MQNQNQRNYLTNLLFQDDWHEASVMWKVTEVRLVIGVEWGVLGHKRESVTRRISDRFSVF